jgi:hypothetical protein
MKGLRNSLALFAASVGLAVVAPAQETPVSALVEGMQTNYSHAHLSMIAKAEPVVALNSKVKVSGLFVDCVIAPRQTWQALTLPTPSLQPAVPPQLRPISPPPAPNHDLAVHDPDFAVLRISFP